MKSPILIQGAAENNLRDIDVEIGRGLTVVTGVSGSGKTSLAYDTLYHEARRRFLEIFALGSTGLRLAPARVRAISGLGPAVAVGQNLLNRNPNSTVASASGLHPFLRLLYARCGERQCPRCGAGLAVWSQDEIVADLARLAQGGPVEVLAPLLHRAAGSQRTLLALLAREFGTQALVVDGRRWDGQALDPHQAHDLAVVVARLPAQAKASAARAAFQQAAALGASALLALPGREDGGARLYSFAPACPVCGTWFGDLEPVHFASACPHCQGSGCERCHGTGLHPAAAATRWQGLRLPELLGGTVEAALALLHSSGLDTTAPRLQSEIERRLEALVTVGLGYLSLDRPAPSLSRGEAQRVRLAVALTSRLEDMLHVLDEPTIGQHPADVARLLPAFRRLAGPVVYVEHDRAAAAAADQAIDLGPGAGSQGGRLLFSGSPAGLWQADTPSGRYFSLRSRPALPARRPAPERFLVVRGAHLRNLQEIDIPIPLNRLSVISGVSGSGKSTFVEDVLAASLERGQPAGCLALEGPRLKPVLVDQAPIGANPRSNPATYTKLAEIIRDLFARESGLSPSHFSFNRPEGACPTCQGMGANEVKLRYLPSTWIPCVDCGGRRFSDEVLAARVAFGESELSIADFYQLTIAEAAPLLLENERLASNQRQAAGQILAALQDIGLGYLPLGQASPSLSGGEAQRVKLAKYLGRRSLTGQLLALDEPSTGLHPQDLAGLLAVLDRLARRGATIVVVEHNLDVVQAADWVVDLGPGAGPEGGRLMYAGPPEGLEQAAGSLTGQALRDESAIQPRSKSPAPADGPAGRLRIREARANNLKNVSVDFPKGALAVVTGVSGSGKSSLVGDVLEMEARRRFLESLAMYERQSTREGPEAPVGSVEGLGVAVAIGPERRRYDSRATVGSASEISHHLAILLAYSGRRRCPQCGVEMGRKTAWICPDCGFSAPLPEPRHFSPGTYAAACQTCHGVGSLQVPAPEKLIVHPEQPLCAGAMYSPGFFPKGYLCKPYNNGYDLVQALAARYEFDPETTPWNQMAAEAQQAFLFGDPQPLQVTYHSRSGRTQTREDPFPGFYGWIRDWDVGGTYTRTQACPDCQGARLRPQYAAVTLGGESLQRLSEMPLAQLERVLRSLAAEESARAEGITAKIARPSLDTALRRLDFLLRVGLGYLQLNRPSGSLSAGEAQRIKLAGLLGSQLTSLTILLDEPTRGLHPAEVSALVETLLALRDEGNTVIVVEHDPLLMRAADYLVDLGPGAGAAGGEIVARGTPEEVARTDTLTASWLRGERQAGDLRDGRPRREPRGWLVVRGARANNLREAEVRFPLGMLVGICGVSGSGKSTLLIDTLGRALAPRKQTTSVAQEPVTPGEHEAIEGAPARAILVDQTRAGITSPAAYLGLSRPLASLYAESEDAQALGLGAERLAGKCSACGGSGSLKTDMGFLPAMYTPCDTCRGTGCRPEAWEARLRGYALPEVLNLTISEVHDLFADQPALARPLAAAGEVGLGYLALRQPGAALSGGEAQRLKIAAELCRQARAETLYILDEPTVGQHLEDVARLSGVLHRLVEAGHSVLVVEHHPHLLAACDWLVELGPGGGPEGGRVIASGRPENLASGDTPSAPFIKEVLTKQP